jgi:hypothetical protein
MFAKNDFIKRYKRLVVATRVSLLFHRARMSTEVYRNYVSLLILGLVSYFAYQILLWVIIAHSEFVLETHEDANNDQMNELQNENDVSIREKVTARPIDDFEISDQKLREIEICCDDLISAVKLVRDTADFIENDFDEKMAGLSVRMYEANRRVALLLFRMRERSS